MPAIAFDTLAYAKEVEEAGFTRQQAEAFAWAQKKLLQDVMSSSEVATKSDLNDVRAELKEEIANTKHEILKWTIATVIAQTALIVAVMAFLR